MVRTRTSRPRALSSWTTASTLPMPRLRALLTVVGALAWASTATAAGVPGGLLPLPLPPDAPAPVQSEVCFPPELFDEAAGDDADASIDDDELGVDPETEDAALAASGTDTGAGADSEAESHELPSGPGADGLRYTSEISDEELKVRWAEEPETLGSMSIGFTDAGRVINAVPFPTGGNWIVVDPRDAWGTRETIDFIVAAIEQVNERIPDTPPLRVNDISSKNGGWLRGHRSHQSGRDVDLGFYYPTAEPIRIRARETCIDVARNWALVRALVTTGDVQTILVDRRVQAVLYRYALSIGEDEAWLDSLFHSGPDALVKHARRHRDHFHVRYHNGRAQELGRRVQPLLAMRPEHNVTTHKVRRGDTLGHIAKRYGTSVNALKKKNGLRNSFLRLGRMLTIPMRGPCTQCPLPAPVLVPPRRLPPDMAPDSEESAPIAALPADITLVAPLGVVDATGFEERADTLEPAAPSIDAASDITSRPQQSAEPVVREIRSDGPGAPVTGASAVPAKNAGR